MSTKYDSILDTIGRTPAVRIRKLAPPGVTMYAKLEAFNPMGSVKDRLALGVIEDAERRGLLKPGQTVIEATSGNTGIGLAMVCAAKGYRLVVTMAENFSVERRRLLRFFGAKVVLTPAALKGSGMLAKAVELADKHGWFLCRQFENEANAEMHSRTTARELLADFEGERFDYWVTGYGTGGTLKGVARVLKAERPEVSVIVCEPDNAPVLASGIAQKRRDDGTPAESHPLFRPHLMQGWSPDFIPKLTEDAVDAHWIDRVIPIDGNEALRLSRELARQEGIFTGISGGATFAGALEVAKGAPEGSTLVFMLPDTGERYLSTPLFADIPVDMTDEEWTIARSTPGYRFDAPPPAAPAQAPAAAVPVTAEVRAFFDEVLADRGQPLVMFALEWCEFCWAVRKLFAHCGIPYRAIDLDSVEFQEGDRGGQLRALLRERIGSPTIPQVFIAGEHIGGCTETFAAFKQGQLQTALRDAGVAFEAVQVDPDRFLPGWRQRS